MKKLFIILGLVYFTNIYTQSLFMPTDFYICDKKHEAKRIIKRFDKAVIGRDYVKDGDGKYYIELEEDDINEYYERFGIKFHCIPKRKREKIVLLMLINDDGEWNDEETYF